MSKNNLMKTFLAIVSVAFLIGTVACNNGGGGGGGSSTTSYYMSNGQCYATGGTLVSMSNCSGLSTNGYSLVNGQCVYTATNQVATPQYCQMGTMSSTISNYPTGIYPTTGIYAAMCAGVYYYAIYGYFQPVYCAGYPDNCAGYTLVNAYGAYQYCM